MKIFWNWELLIVELGRTFKRQTILSFETENDWPAINWSFHFPDFFQTIG